ncbi:hypothetical protein QOZ80_9BG0697840 [Eleusine coracana subsp. coracana]|nr:hypothetical protein QOZ80_9BG0697840 [Eleusine coracana subsp. coracana]
MGDKLEQFHGTSLRPPHHDPQDADHHLLPPATSSCLLDRMAYIADRTNASTASCRTSRGGGGGGEIQVTFVLAPPPRVSHLCVFCPGSPPTAFACEPIVVAMEANLVLIRVAFGEPKNANRAKKHDYFLYQQAAGAGERNKAPSLRQIPHPKPFVFFGEHRIGLLPCYDEEHPDLFYIAALPYRSKTTTANQLPFYLYNSETDRWSTKTASLDGNENHLDLRTFRCTKVIAIGGDGSSSGVVACWVDLWLGLLHCNVLDATPTLRYTPLPPPLHPENELSGCPWLTRDIAVIQGRISYVELDVRVLGIDCNGRYIADGWMAVVWSRTAANPWDEDDWRKEFSVDSDFVCADDPVLLGQLPSLRDYRGRPEPTLLRIHIGHPTLSLQGDAVVYLMAKAKFMDDDAWVVAFDMTGNGSLKAVARFGAERTMGISFSYVHSRISEYLNLDPAFVVNCTSSAQI